MTSMAVTEAIFYMPSDPKERALRLHKGGRAGGHVCRRVVGGRVCGG